jgi:hypothetical protein
MASQFYLVYSVLVDEVTGTPSSLLHLYTDENGTPLETGTLVKTFAGTGPGLSAVLVDGTYKPNKTAWTDEMSAAGESLAVNVTDAGSEHALIRFLHDGESLCFPVPEYRFAQSESYLAFFTYNREGAAAAATSLGYTSAITAVTPLGADALRVEGWLDAAASSHVLRRRMVGEPQTYVDTPLFAEADDTFSVQIVALAPDSEYSFEIVSTGTRGSSTSPTVTGRTGVAAPLAVPTFAIENTENAAVKKVVIADVPAASAFDAQIAADGDFDGAPLTLRVTNNGGAELYIRQWPESESDLYAIRVKSVSGVDGHTDSAWSDSQETSIGGGSVTASGAEIPFYANIAVHAEPSAPEHAATLGKVNDLLAEAVDGFGTVVHSVAGYTGTVTVPQILVGAAEENLLVNHNSGPLGNLNDESMITAESLDNQLASAKAIYHYVQNVRAALSGQLGAHYHSYLYTDNGQTVLSTPALDDEATIVPDIALADPFDPAVTYEADAVVVLEGYLYRNTSGTSSTGNRDFTRKWTKTTASALMAASTGSGSDRYETEFLGADLDADCAIEISHGLGEQYVFVQVIDLTEGSGNLVVAAQINLTDTSKLQLKFSESLPASSRFKVIVRS